MSLRFFEGPAGSGKTTSLFEELAATLEVRPLGEHERVLALTKMHGSRRRMQGRLSAQPSLRGRFECTTIDSFAWRICRRWRSLASVKGVAEFAGNDYETVCAAAGALLSIPLVSRWTVRSFPVLVVDEMQDSKKGQLELIRALAETAICLAAADDYQDLDASGENAAVAWAHQNGEVVSLTNIHRTNAKGLLSAASALRGGQAIPFNGGGFKVLGAQNANVGASYVAKNLTWWSKSADIAIITPVSAENSQFVRDLLQRVEQAPIGSPPCGPHRVPWEVSQADQCKLFLSGLALPSDPSAEICVSSLCLPDEGGTSKAIRTWLNRRRSLAGTTTLSVREIQHQVQLIHQRSRAYRRLRDCGVRAMTVHQAKNREFDSVIVLWPYQIAGSADRRRRLLYNAITRARRQVLVVVQDPNRLKKPPFVADGGTTTK